MSRYPHNRWQQPQVIYQPRRKRQRKQVHYRFRWEWILVPLIVLVLIYILSGIEVGFSWDEFLDDIDIHNKEQFTRVFVFCVLCTAIVAITRVLRAGKKGD